MHMRTPRLVFFGPIGVLTIGSAFGQIVQQKGGYMIFVKYSKGQVLKQEMSAHLVSDAKKQSKSTFVTKCTGFDKKGFTLLDVTPPTVGKTPSKVKHIKVDKHGKPIGNAIDGYGGTFAWPEFPVKVGQSWDGDINVAGSPGQPSGMIMKSTYKVTGVKTINGVKVMAITSVMKVSGNYDISGTGTIYVRFSDGQTQSADFDMLFSNLKIAMNIRTIK